MVIEIPNAEFYSVTCTCTRDVDVVTHFVAQSKIYKN